MDIDVRKLIDDKDCIVCKHTSLSVGSDKCTKCLSSGTRSEFELCHSCLTCKHRKKLITEEPCMVCESQRRDHKWEETE